MTVATGICYQNQEGTVVLIDIPTSITYAQGPTASSSNSILLSSAPRKVPFPIANEPSKGSRSTTNSYDVEYHGHMRNLIKKAIEEIRLSHISPWCLPRKWVTETMQCSSKKRKRKNKNEADQDEVAESGQLGLQEIQAGTGLEDGTTSSKQTDNTSSDTEKLYIMNKPLTDLEESFIRNRVFHNTAYDTLSLSFLRSKISPSQRFSMPAHSTFLLASIQDSISTFKSAAKCLIPSDTSYPGPGQFNFILLDPPWPNASAKRARSYRRLRSVSDTEELLRSMQLEDHIGLGGFVGIWITNKQQIRDRLLGKTAATQDPKQKHAFSQSHPSTYSNRIGLFAQWDIELVEEWVWIKTTSQGDPITDLESAWRKPYEILLLGRRKAPDHPERASRPDHASIKRRIIAGVPDLHSRKPSLKALVESLLFDGKPYRALEIFARHLTCGWWAWGDEVLKFNWEGAWGEKTTKNDGDDDAAELEHRRILEGCFRPDYLSEFISGGFLASCPKETIAPAIGGAHSMISAGIGPPSIGR